MKTKKQHTTADSTSSPPRPPDYHVWAVDKKTGLKGDIGAAWANPDGTIRIKLNFSVVLDSGMTEYDIRLYPSVDKNGRAN